MNVGPARGCLMRALAVPLVCAAPGLSCGSSPPPIAEAPATVYKFAGAPPPKPPEVEEAPAVVERPRPRSEWTVLSRGKDLATALRELARDAASKQLLPVVFVGQKNCEPCESLKSYRNDPRMQDALLGTSIVEVDLGRWPSSELSMLGMSTHAIPALFVLDVGGQYTGKMITGGAWGDDIPENMAPPLTDFFLRARQP
ncbi:MAG: hypothetical protein HY898_07145 [Deltaproteobacteria bacterium]|nr:hypothetical protein [Deltaproteobacteria bacterium]